MQSTYHTIYLQLQSYIQYNPPSSTSKNLADLALYFQFFYNCIYLLFMQYICTKNIEGFIRINQKLKYIMFPIFVNKTSKVEREGWSCGKLKQQELVIDYSNYRDKNEKIITSLYASSYQYRDRHIFIPWRQIEVYYVVLIYKIHWHICRIYF